jgi:hypothetical protein
MALVSNVQKLSASGLCCKYCPCRIAESSVFLVLATRNDYRRPIGLSLLGGGGNSSISGLRNGLWRKHPTRFFLTAARSVTGWQGSAVIAVMVGNIPSTHNLK